MADRATQRRTLRKGATAAYEEYRLAVAALLQALERERDPWDRARVGKAAAEDARADQSEFADQRSAAIIELREEGWSLTDLSKELQIARARIAQIAPIEGDRAQTGERYDYKRGKGRPE